MDELTWKTLLLIAVLLVVFVGAHYATKFLSGRAKGSLRGGYMRIRESILLGRDKQIVLLEVGAKFYLIGIGGQSVTLVGTIEKNELTPLVEQKETGSTFSGFREMLQKAQSGGKTAPDDRLLKRSRAFARGRADQGDGQPQEAQGEPDDIDMLLRAIKRKSLRNTSAGGEETHEP